MYDFETCIYRFPGSLAIWPKDHQQLTHILKLYTGDVFGIRLIFILGSYLSAFSSSFVRSKMYGMDYMYIIVGPMTIVHMLESRNAMRLS